MRRVYEFLLLSLLASPAFAAGPDYQAGVKDSITVNCVNPTARTDGKALAWATEGGHVDWYIGKDAALGTTALSGRLGQGCKATTVDLKPLATGQQYYLHVKASDTAERTSGPSSGFAFFRSAQAAEPNLAQGRPITVSSLESASYGGGYAVDGKTTTRWASVLPGRATEWLTVDLGGTYNVSHVVILFESAYAKAYQIQVSTDNLTWTTIASTTTGNGGTDDMLATANNEARYVRVYMTTRATAWGYSIYELSVYGTPVAGPTPCTPAEEAACTATFNSCMAACNQ